MKYILFMEQEFDTILILDQRVCEAYDDRRAVSTVAASSPQSMYGSVYKDFIDPSLYAGWSYGNQLYANLSRMGNGFSCQVSDFGKEVVVTITHSNNVTGRSASKTFLIVFNNTKGEAIVKSHAGKYRTISGIGQAESYIRSACSALLSTNQSKL